ncbi:MAG: hypothetical protein U1E23_04070 [Reyranellaceae bacterium]
MVNEPTLFQPPELMRARALHQRQQAARARRLANSIPNDEMARRLSELAGQLEREAARDEHAAVEAAHRARKP